MKHREAPEPQPTHEDVENSRKRGHKALRWVGGTALAITVGIAGGTVARAIHPPGGQNESAPAATSETTQDPTDHPPVTYESTPELEAAREQARETAVDLSDRIMDLYDEAPEGHRNEDRDSMPGYAVITVDVDAPAGEGGLEGSYGMSTKIRLDANGDIDPRNVEGVTISLYEKNQTPDQLPTSRYNFDISSLQDGADGPVEWSLREGIMPVGAPSQLQDRSTAPLPVSRTADMLETHHVTEAGNHANEILDLAAQGAPLR